MSPQKCLEMAGKRSDFSKRLKITTGMMIHQEGIDDVTLYLIATDLPYHG